MPRAEYRPRKFGSADYAKSLDERVTRVAAEVGLAFDLAAQTRETLARVKNNLALAGLTPADVVDSTVYLAEPWQRHLVEPVYREFFPIDPPARTLVGTDLVQRSALIEVLVTAYK